MTKQYITNKLTNRQIEVLGMVCNGRTVEEISIALSISKRTVNNHIHNAFYRLRVHSIHQAVLIYKRKQNGVETHNLCRT